MYTVGKIGTAKGYTAGKIGPAKGYTEGKIGTANGYTAGKILVLTYFWSISGMWMLLNKQIILLAKSASKANEQCIG